MFGASGCGAPGIAGGCAHHGDPGAQPLQPDQPSRVFSLNRRLAFEFHAQFGEERDGRVEVGHHNGHVVHAFERHGGSIGSVKGERGPPRA